jgi:hypothetical protein
MNNFFFQISLNCRARNAKNLKVISHYFTVNDVKFKSFWFYTKVADIFVVTARQVIPI